METPEETPDNLSKPDMEGCIKREEPALEMGIEDIDEVLSSACLVSIKVGDFLVIMRSEFDLTISGEPYTGLMMLLNPRTGKYISRLWNQTVETGSIVHTDQFKEEDQLLEACERHFGNGRPCLGRPEEEGRPADAKFFISQTPVPRIISRGCLKYLGHDSESTVTSCSECTKLSDSSLSGADDTVEYIEGPSSSRKFIKKAGVNDSLTGGEYKNEYVGDVDVEEMVIKPEILDPLDGQEGGSAGYYEVDNQSAMQMNKDPFAPEDDNKPFKCELCPFSSVKQSNLKKHVEAVHEKIKRYACKHLNCNFRSSTNANLKSHIMSVHEKRKDHFCPACGKSFTKANNLKIHFQGVHLKVKNFFCGVCGRGFLTKQEMTRHAKRHDDLPGVPVIRNGPNTGGQLYPTHLDPQGE